MRIAALDLGSNSFHLVVVDAHADGNFDTLLREKEILRLGDVVARHGRLPDHAADQAVLVVARFRALAESVAADEIVACATSALREADNGSEVVDRIEAETGTRVQVISGKDEARLIFGAVRASVLIDPGPALCLDLGGGSLEVVVGDAGGLLWSASVKLGVGRLTAELVRNDPPSGGDLRRLRKRITSVLGPLVREAADFESRLLVGTSGTLCALARMAAAYQTGTVPDSVNQLTVRRHDLAAVLDRAMAVPTAERQKLAGLDSRRADLVPAGGLVLMTAMDLFGFDELTVSEWALREGMVLDAIGHHDPVDWTAEPRDLRREAVLSLCRRCGWDESHGRQVARLATELFDCTLPLHRLGAVERELLEYAGYLHDIGEHVSVEGHDKHTAYLIQHGRLRGFDPSEVAMLASLGRFHRRGNPKVTFEPFESLPQVGRETVCHLAALLRIADGLDRSRTGSVEGVEAELTPDCVRLRVRAFDDIELELWGLRRKRELFERVFIRRLEVSVEVGRDDPAELSVG